MKEQFVPYDMSLELKEIGFDEDCLKLWEHTSIYTVLVDPSEFKKVVSERFVKAPLYQQVFKWFRNTYTMNSYVDGAGFKGYQYCINGTVVGKTFPSYEEAELECIKELIKFIKK